VEQAEKPKNLREVEGMPTPHAEKKIVSVLGRLS
jgi:hypothetical protein